MKHISLVVAIMGGILLLLSLPGTGPTGAIPAPQTTITPTAFNYLPFVAGGGPSFQVFLSPNGNDSNDGLSLETPILTLGRAQEIIMAQPPADDFEVRIAPGRYFGQRVVWTYTLPDHTITFRRLGDDGDRPIFDGCDENGNCPGGTWFTLQHSAGERTNLNFEYIRVENYRTAISLKGNRNSAGSSNSHNRIYGCYFYRIGNVFNPSLKRSPSAVGLENSDANLVRNNHFVDVINAEESQQRGLHALYVAHLSQGNVITHNRFWNVGGDPVKFRDGSSDNVVANNLFHKTGHTAAVKDAYCRNDESLFLEPDIWNNAGTQGGRGWYVGDYNGDGRDDILSYINPSGGADIFLSTGSSFSHEGRWTGFGTRGGRGWYVGDYNGDGKDDILRYANQHGGADVLLNYGTSFGQPADWSEDWKVPTSVRGGEGWYVGDYNGDGKDDILRYVNQYGGAEVFLSSGSSFSYYGEWTGFGTRGGEGWYVGDYNGDGKDDILRYVNQYGGADVFFSTGARFDHIGEWTGYGTRGGRGWYVGDFDGDGSDDLLRYATSHVGGADVLLNYGNSFGQAVDWTEHWEVPTSVPGGEGWYIGHYRGRNRAHILRYVNENGGAQVAVQVCTKDTPECPSWNNGVRDNTLDGRYDCEALLLPSVIAQPQAPPPGCPAPDPSWERIRLLGSNTDPDGIACSGN